MRFTKEIITMATCAVMTASSMVGMSASAAQIGGGQITYVNVPLIIQTEPNNCSATTLAELLYGLGVEDEIPGNNEEAKIDYLWDNYKELGDTGYSIFVYNIVDVLNQYVSFYEYDYIEKCNLTDSSDLEGKIHMSLWYNRPVAIRASTGGLSYYNGVNLTHYIAVSRSDALNHTFTVVDCNNAEDDNGNLLYGDYHYNVPLSDVYNCTTYMIYGS